jgi:hypothetical protein
MILQPFDRFFSSFRLINFAYYKIETKWHTFIPSPKLLGEGRFFIEGIGINMSLAL